MKNFIKLFCLIYIFTVLKVNAQNYLISFTGTGTSTTVSSVKVENLTKSTFLIVNGNDILRLALVTAINSIEDNQSSKIKVYPNPMSDNSTLVIYPPVAGDATISVYDMIGKPVAQIQSFLENFRQDFRLSGLKSGFYLINVRGNSYQLSSKLLSNDNSNGTISIKKLNNSDQRVDDKTE